MATPIADEGLERLRAEAESADRGEGVSLAGMSREERRKALAGTTPVNSEPLYSGYLDMDEEHTRVPQIADSEELEAMIEAGERLATCAFNLSQRAHLTINERLSLDESRQQWDKARKALASPLPLRGL